MDQVVAEADIVSLHVPLDSQTRGLINASRIALMKRGAIIINTSRGGIVDEVAVAAALRAGSLAGAALDVFEHEPLAANSALADVPNLILTPHIAGVTQESNVRVGALIAERRRHCACCERDDGIFTAAPRDALPQQALVNAGASAEMAATTARALMAADAQGLASHGVARSQYAAHLRMAAPTGRLSLASCVRNYPRA